MGVLDLFCPPDFGWGSIGRKRTVVFILSSRRSGSNWVGYVLGSHSRSAFLGEFYRGWSPEKRRPCTYCQAQGLSACKLLSGFEDVPEANAFDFAFSRLKRKKVLVDCSKRPTWAAQFLANRDFDCKFIHLVRDPRGFYCSEKRRLPPELWPELIPKWIRQNVKIHRFITKSNVPAQIVFYDQLAKNPEIGFKKLFDFVGLKFKRGALEYWNFAHHGFAANGASSLVLASLDNVTEEPCVLTGDDAFYQARRNSLFHDQRWEEQLSSAEIAAIEGTSELSDVLERLGRPPEEFDPPINFSGGVDDGLANRELDKPVANLEV